MLSFARCVAQPLCRRHLCWLARTGVGNDSLGAGVRWVDAVTLCHGAEIPLVVGGAVGVTR